MTDNSVQFLPFNAINEFMRTDFRLNIVRKTLSNLRNLPEKEQENVNRQIKRTVKVPGFRNSEKAPAAVKVIPTAKAFEADPSLSAAIISAWTAIHTELRDQVFQVLKKRGWYILSAEIKSPADFPTLTTEKDWGILPVEADRTVLPGFLMYWPKGQDFEDIYASFTSLFPDAAYSIDEVSLMTVWLANRLPYKVLDADKSEIASEPESE